MALFLFLNGYSRKKTIYVSTQNRVIILYILKNHNICVDMGIPIFNPKYIPYINTNHQKFYSVSILKRIIKYYVVSMGNPHCVVIVENVKKYPVEQIGSTLSTYKLFPEGTNVIFMQIISKTHIVLRVYERGVGETRSCGSGACAAVAIGIKHNMLFNEVHVDLVGGQLKVNWNGNSNSLYMTGSATHVYSGYFYM